MIKLIDLLPILKGFVTIHFRDGRPDDLIVCEALPAEDIHDRLLKAGLRFFNYHVLEMYAVTFDIGVDEECECLKIILVR